MPVRAWLLAFCLLSIAFSAVPASAETRYVTDQLTLTLRRGMGEEYKILKLLRTGNPVEVLEEYDDYLKVRTEDGTEGYVLKRYITSETPKSILIARLEKEKERLAAALEKERSGQTDLGKDLAAVRAEADGLRKQSAEMEKELAAARNSYQDLREKSENVVQLAAEHAQLQAENAQLAAEVEKLREENADLFVDAMIKWFLAGGGVFLGGWIVGKISRRKRGGFA